MCKKAKKGPAKVLLGVLAVYVLWRILMQWGIWEASETGIRRGIDYTSVNGSGEAKENSGEKRIALTFDDGPHPVYTQKLLEGLREREVHATFFLLGCMVEQHPELVREMVEDGHLIGSHAYSHVQLTSLSLSKARAELEAANESILQACGYEVRYIRPPYGAWNDELMELFDWTEVGWTVDPEDWKKRDCLAVTKHVLSHVENDGIILLHDIFDSSVDAALQIIDALKKDGWEFVTVDDLILD